MTHEMVIRVGVHIYAWKWTTERLGQALKTVCLQAASPELNLNWHHAAYVTQAMRRVSTEEEEGMEGRPGRASHGGPWA